MTRRPVLAISSHPESPATVEMALWLSYCQGVGEVIARHRTALSSVQHEPVRYDLVRDAVVEDFEEGS